MTIIKKQDDPANEKRIAEMENDSENKDVFKISSTLLRSPVLILRSGSSVENIRESNFGQEKALVPKNNFDRLGENITKPNVFVEGRSNIHKQIMSMIKVVHALYTRCVQKVLRILCFFKNYLFIHEYLFCPLQSNPHQILYTCANVFSNPRSSSKNYFL